MRASLARALDSTRTVHLAAAASLALSLFFIFVWSPLPWGWRGIDFYDDLAKALARGESFQTTDVPWGYAYFLAAFYALAGDRAWVPLVAQAALNACAPLLLYHLVRPLASQRVAVLSALLTGLFSFNTVYTSTRSADSVCTVLFLASLLAFAEGHRRNRTSLFALSGVLFGLVPQFRPNLILLPVAIAGLYVLAAFRPSVSSASSVADSFAPYAARRLVQMAVLGACMTFVQVPWIVRNYRLTGIVMPTSTHGGEQLWYGSLQVGPYLESRAHNPRWVFRSAAFDYTSLVNRPILVSANLVQCGHEPDPLPALWYWTDRDVRPVRLAAPRRHEGRAVEYEVPGQPDGTVVYYLFEQVRPLPGGGSLTRSVPLRGALGPFISFVSSDHLGDLDRNGDLLDIFDVVRLARHLAWGESVPFAAKLDLDRDGAIGQADLSAAMNLLLPEARDDAMTSLEVTPGAAAVHLADGSAVSVPRAFAGRVTDLDVRGGELAAELVSRRRSFSRLREPPVACAFVEDVGFNRVFYRAEPHMQNRFVALAYDNIRRDPVAFAAACAYRIVRMFIVRGTQDAATTQQFRWAWLAYGAGQWVSAAYFLVFLWGVWLAWRQRSALLVLAIPIVYVPLTICFVLTNMRYTITVQPLMFGFVAGALVRMLKPEREVLES
jgi:hypothetical protein